jgi:hypothetical protein
LNNGAGGLTMIENDILFGGRGNYEEEDKRDPEMDLSISSLNNLLNIKEDISII